jgi:hypothetical protein
VWVSMIAWHGKRTTVRLFFLVSAQPKVVVVPVARFNLRNGWHLIESHRIEPVSSSSSSSFHACRGGGGAEGRRRDNAKKNTFAPSAGLHPEQPFTLSPQ